MIRRYDAEVFAFDPTPKSLAWLAKQRIPGKMRVIPFGLADFDGEQHFGLPLKEEWDSFSVRRTDAKSVRCEVKTRHPSIHENRINELCPTGVDVLKMDIEGSEYPVIADLCQSKIRPKQLLVEFHHRMEDIWLPGDSRSSQPSLRSAGS